MATKPCSLHGFQRGVMRLHLLLGRLGSVEILRKRINGRREGAITWNVSEMELGLKQEVFLQ